MSYHLLGPSHGMPFDYRDMNERLEEITNTKIINLSTPGGGILPMRFIIEYFMESHNTKNVLYILDSFVFYSKAWNEERFNDIKIYKRTPLDPILLKMLLSYTIANEINFTAFLDYISGFSKINNQDRFKPDIRADERKFGRKYRFLKSRHKKRIDYLYPEKEVDKEVFEKYLGIFADLIKFLKSRDIGLVVLKTPMPTHIYEMIPRENEFNKKIQEVLREEEVPFYDFSLKNNQK